ncbi:hypothetical protein JHK82_015864 [Glycine max]|nr:hypothetical protein JHK85_016267 [Glycine max]KAG5046485.1 hypothetical protein JHK86_015891 [Glycine max]KAG5148983.1 hypothetical protein JHK82_015864 [Glycine max]
MHLENENNTLVKERDRLVRETKRLEESINRERKLLGKVMKVLLGKELVVATRTDTKGQTTLHMAVKGQSLEVVEELIKADPSTINMVDNKGMWQAVLSLLEKPEVLYLIHEVIGSPGKYLSRVEKEVIEGNGINELQELKDNLLHRHNNYITNLKHEISKKKKKEKLPTKVDKALKLDEYEETLTPMSTPEEVDEKLELEEYE